MDALERKRLRKLRSLVSNKEGAEAGLAAKQEAVQALKKAHRKFNKLDALNGMIDEGVPGAAKAKRKMNDSWTKRQSNNLTGLWNNKRAKPGAVVEIKQ